MIRTEVGRLLRYLRKRFIPNSWKVREQQELKERCNIMATYKITARTTDDWNEQTLNIGIENITLDLSNFDNWVLGNLNGGGLLKLTIEKVDDEEDEDGTGKEIPEIATVVGTTITEALSTDTLLMTVKLK